ncbi:CopM family metallochaperone [Sinorhizobium fredii]|uniref:DUF305 domain-containing protein n=2 Tax=Rhizobium fredii TaxID=380 RepID=A0A2A6LVD3_RHIFR|nr:DUF305 domain-containing protein [Sinorhizobium fredii]ASY67860.1 putative exported protein [Sinorhizobium fredii CCBAU 83666]AWI56120.1 hypothetical protein AB395_0000440 [Sinorhizobium fredii CCBAU 45436]PDT46287.1 DUF305 domain-containing protein [Sinorhizobium fredii]CCE94967.1 Uncharacterized protein SFHH103_00467 [Sinorhizobium fredii HH103]
MSLKRILTALIIAASVGSAAFSQESGHQGMNHNSTAAESAPSSRAFAEANAKMHKDMDIVFTGNADVDFVRGMIAHHQGAIDMAKVELEYGKDEAIRKLAENIIKAQEAEITMMKEWLAGHGG